MNISIIIILVPLILRHAHHFWCIRHASRQVKKKGMASVIIWFFSYILLAAGSLYSVYQFEISLYTIIGFIILWIAVFGRMLSIHQLGKAFSEFIFIGENQPLVDTGIYSAIRHPLHYFLILEMVSFAWIIGGLWSWTMVVFSFVTMIFREIQEEKELICAFGEKYLVYKSKTFALIDLFPVHWIKK